MIERLHCIEINPATNPVGTVIWLHGLGADGNDFVPLVPELKLPDTLPLRFVFPHAPMIPVTINNGYVMRAWYDIVAMSIDHHADKSGIDDSVKKIHELISHEEKLGIKTENIILAGFSQGAVIALTTALTFPQTLGGVIALSGYLPEPEKAIKAANPANQTTPIFQGHGKEDALVPYVLGERLHHVLKENHFPVSWHSYAMAHSVCAEEVRDISAWLAKCVTKT